MKIRSTLVAVLATLTLAACSKSESNGPDKDPDEVEAGLATYATFSVTVTNANTRAFHGSLAPTDEEKAINQLTVYIYDLLTNEVEDVLTFNTVDEKKTTLITTGPKKFFATSGITPMFTIGTANIDLENYFMNINNETYFNDEVAKDNKFWMTSDIVGHTVVSATLEEVQAGGHHNNISMKLGRAMAKIGVVYNESLDIKNDADPAIKLGNMKNVEYRVKNQPNRMYLFTDYDASGVWRTPYFNRNNNLWNDSHAASYWYQGTWSTTSIDAQDNHEGYSYMMENSNMTARYGNSTYVSICGQFYPEEWLKSDGTVENTPAIVDSDFWRIAYVDSNGDITGWVSDVIYSDVPDATQYASDGSEAPIKYEDGKMYYWLYLDSSLGSTPPTTTADKYSIHRNQYWDVVITKVTGLGWNEEDGGRPENPEPLDKTAYIEASIEILNWEGVEMEGELKGNN